MRAALIFGILGLNAAQVFAADFTNEVDASTSTRWVVNTAGDTAFSAGGGYHRLVQNKTQLSIRLTFVARAKDNGGTLLSPTLGPTINFAFHTENSKLSDLFFFGPFIGVWYDNTLPDTQTYLAYGVSAGKRFEIQAETITWKPEVRIDGISRRHSNLAFSIIPVQFSIFI